MEPSTEVTSTFSSQQGNTGHDSVNRVNGQTTWCLSAANVPFKSEYPISGSSSSSQRSTFQPTGGSVEAMKEQDNRTMDLLKENFTNLRRLRGAHVDKWNSDSAKVVCLDIY